MRVTLPVQASFKTHTRTQFVMNNVTWYRSIPRIMFFLYHWLAYLSVVSNKFTAHEFTKAVNVCLSVGHYDTCQNEIQHLVLSLLFHKWHLCSSTVNDRFIERDALQKSTNTQSKHLFNSFLFVSIVMKVHRYHESSKLTPVAKVFHNSFCIRIYRGNILFLCLLIFCDRSLNGLLFGIQKSFNAYYKPKWHVCKENVLQKESHNATLQRK